jgi:uncharacterized alpha-E superfamily protein
MLLSSVAETMFWTGRYIERANALSRTVQGYERLCLDLPGARSLDFRPLLGLVGRESRASTELARDVSALLGVLVLDPNNPSSVKGALGRARENLRQARVMTPPKVWETLNALFVDLSRTDGEHVPAIMGVLEKVAFACDRIEGELDASMTRDGAYSFLRMGRHVERTDMLLRTMSALLPTLGTIGISRAYDDVRSLGFLRLIGAHSMYSRRHHARAELRTILAFLVLEATFPRSVIHALHVIDRELLGLPLQQKPRNAVQFSIEQAHALGASAPDELSARLASMLASLETLHDAICGAYFPAEPASAPADGVTNVGAPGPVAEQTEVPGASSSAQRAAGREQASALPTSGG